MIHKVYLKKNNHDFCRWLTWLCVCSGEKHATMQISEAFRRNMLHCPFWPVSKFFFLARELGSKQLGKNRIRVGVSKHAWDLNYIPLNILYFGFEFSFQVSKAALLSLRYTALPATYTYTEWGVQGSAISTVLQQRRESRKIKWR